MFHKTSLLAVALALFAAASPVENITPGIRIPLRDRASLTRPDGTFNFENAILQTVATKNKHRQNLINIERNAGRKAFNKGAEILPVATVRKGRLRQRHQSEPLVDVQNSSAWAGIVSIGTLPQDFLIDFDTGSSDLWVASSSCRSPACSSRSLYDAGASDTSVEQKDSFTIVYGDGSTVSGPIYTDNVTVAEVEATGQVFSAVNTLSSAFDGNPIDGVLGLGYPATSAMNAIPFFNSVMQQNTVQQGLFGFKLTSGDSSLFLGGVDDSLFHDDLEYHNVVTWSGFWQLANAQILVGRNPNVVVSNFQTIIDSGTTITYGPPAAVAQVYAQVPGSRVYDPENGYYSFPCSQVPSVFFSWDGGNYWEILPENFNLGQIAPNSDRCVGALSAQNLGLGSNVWLLGDSFMQNVYTAFSFDTNAVGFAPLAS